MPDGVTVAQLTLDQFVQVQILVGQPSVSRGDCCNIDFEILRAWDRY